MTIIARNYADSQQKTKTGTEKHVFTTLAWMANDENKCWPSYDYLAQRCGYSKRTIVRVVNRLEEYGLIHKERRQTKKGGDTSNMFTVCVSDELGRILEDDDYQVADYHDAALRRYDAHDEYADIESAEVVCAPEQYDDVSDDDDDDDWPSWMSRSIKPYYPDLSGDAGHRYLPDDDAGDFWSDDASPSCPDNDECAGDDFFCVQPQCHREGDITSTEYTSNIQNKKSRLADYATVDETKNQKPKTKNQESRLADYATAHVDESEQAESRLADYATSPVGESEQTKSPEAQNNYADHETSWTPDDNPHREQSNADAPKHLATRDFYVCDYWDEMDVDTPPPPRGKRRAGKSCFGVWDDLDGHQAPHNAAVSDSFVHNQADRVVDVHEYGLAILEYLGVDTTYWQTGRRGFRVLGEWLAKYQVWAIDAFVGMQRGYLAEANDPFAYANRYIETNLCKCYGYDTSWLRTDGEAE